MVLEIKEVAQVTDVVGVEVEVSLVVQELMVAEVMETLGIVIMILMDMVVVLQVIPLIHVVGVLTYLVVLVRGRLMLGQVLVVASMYREPIILVIKS